MQVGGFRDIPSEISLEVFRSYRMYLYLFVMEPAEKAILRLIILLCFPGALRNCCC